MPGGHDRRGMVGDLRLLAAAHPPQAQADDQQGRDGGADDHADARPAGRLQGAEERRQRDGPEDHQHHRHEEGLVLREVRVDHIGQRGGQEDQDGREPDDVLGPVAPHGQEPPPRAERLAHPAVDAAAHGGGQLGRAQGHRYQIGEYRDGVEEDRRPPEGGGGRQVADAVHGRDEDQGQSDHSQPAGGQPPTCARPTGWAGP